MKAYTHITVLDEQSLQRLHKLGMTNCSLAKDPLFDKAQAIARTPYHNTIVERFVKGRRIFIAGSISDKNDLQLVGTLANRYPDLHFLIVPHDVNSEECAAIQSQLQGRSLSYSQCDDNTDFSQIQSLIIDYVGDLAYLYRYATWAYVGGGFTPYLHSLIESTVYGVPVAFGPRIQRKATALQLKQLEIGEVVTTPAELEEWFLSLRHDEDKLNHIKVVARKYVGRQSGATDEILRMIQL